MCFGEFSLSVIFHTKHIANAKKKVYNKYV